MYWGLMFEIRGRISGNSLSVPCASVHPERQLAQEGTVTLRSRCQLLEQGKERTEDDARQRTRVMKSCFQDGRVCSVSEGRFSHKWALPLLSRVSISAAMFCYPEKEALQHSLTSNKCDMHCKISGSGCWIRSTFHCTVKCCHIPPVSWGRSLWQNWSPLAHSHPHPSSPPSLSTCCQIRGNDDFPLDLGEGSISFWAVRELWLELQKEGRRAQICGAHWGEADTHTEAEEFNIVL